MTEQTRYAEVSWTAADVQTLAPKLSETEAEDWLARNEKYICDRLTEIGWDVISTFLSMDGIDTSSDEDDES
jgi:hypothetical protein